MADAEIINLDDYRSHISLEVFDGTARLIACKDIEAFIKGRLDLADFSTVEVANINENKGYRTRDYKTVLRRIVEEWYNMVRVAK